MAPSPTPAGGSPAGGSPRGGSSRGPGGGGASPAGLAGERPLAPSPRRVELTETEAWAVLASADRVGPAAFAALLARYGSARDVLRAARLRSDRATAAHVASGDGTDPLRDPRLASAIDLAARSAAELLAAVRQAGARIVTAEDPAYPARLRSVELNPPVLFVTGDADAMERDRAVAVVGTRHPSDAGRRDAAMIAGSIARCEASVISGLAVGIDGVAHIAALDEQATTVAVLGSGHLRLSPSGHRRLAERIAGSGGAVVSELPPLVEPARHTFPRRNRIISGLADATIVVEAGPGSGALITAAWALEQGRECFLVPGPLDRTTTMGSLRFLRDHHGLARIVVGVPELIAEIGLESVPAAPPTPTGDLGPCERAVADRLSRSPATLDELVAATGAEPATVLAALTRLELRGLAVDVFGRYRAAGLLATRGPGAGDAARTDRAAGGSRTP